MKLKRCTYHTTLDRSKPEAEQRFIEIQNYEIDTGNLSLVMQYATETNRTPRVLFQNSNEELVKKWFREYAKANDGEES